MTEDFDRFAADYEQELAKGLRLTGESRTHFLRRRLEWLDARLASYGDRRPDHVLDFGCGIGAATPHLLQLLSAQRVFGCDVSEASLDIARQLNSGQAATFTSTIPERQFPLIHVNGVFHHIPPARRLDAAMSLTRALEPGGLLAYFENNPWNPLMVYSMSKVEFDRDAITLTPPESVRLLQGAGLTVLTVDYLFFFPAFLRFLRRFEPLLRGCPLGAQYLVLARRER